MTLQIMSLTTCVVCSVVLVCDRTCTISYSSYVLQGYSEILVSFSFIIKAILKF